jgi:hypothetical protein
VSDVDVPEVDAPTLELAMCCRRYEPYKRNSHQYGITDPISLLSELHHTQTHRLLSIGPLVNMSVRIVFKSREVNSTYLIINIDGRDIVMS